MRDPNIKELLKLYEEGKATEQQRQLVEAWLEWHQRQSPQRDRHSVEEDSPLQEILDKIDAARQRDAEKMETPVYHLEPGEGEGYTGRSRKIRRYGWAAAAAIVLVVGGLLWKTTGRHAEGARLAIVYKTVEARPGQSIHLLLSDSSEVWLSAGSKLRYPQPFGDSIRGVELMDGEAYFQVHSDANRGFEVKTDRLLTRVLGTSFNIKAYRGMQHLSVSVMTGKVSVGTTNAAQNLVLTAHQQVSYNNGTGQLTRSTFASDHILDWKDGSFSFMEESLGDIAIELEHYYNVRIDFKYPGLRKYQVSASFSHQAPLKEILNTLCLLNQNHVTQTDAQHYVIH